MKQSMADEYWMRRAIQLAEAARVRGERPFGCVIVDPVYDCELTVGAGTGSDLDPTTHSECIAIREACQLRRRLCDGLTLYSTHEPCTMCCGAIVHAHMSRVVWGSFRTDLPQLFRPRSMPRQAAALLIDTAHPCDITTGVLRAECVALFAEEAT